MKKVIAAVLAVFGANAAVWADVSVYDVKFQPRTPWNGLVDISYSVACDNPNADVYVTPTAYDGDRRITLFPKTLSGDGAEAAVKPGKHTMTWDAKKDLGIFSSANFSIKMHAGERLPRYVVIDLSSGAESTEYPIRFSVVGPDLSNDICRTTELWLRLVPPGEFWMGSPTDELGRTDNEDLHHVTLTKPFYMGVFEVTQKQWELVEGDVPAYFKDSANASVRPVECVAGKIRGAGRSYSPTAIDIDADSFCGRMRSRTMLSQLNLPSEARWEYACRAGTMTALNNNRNLLSAVADEGLSKIAGYKANCYNNQSYSSSSVLVGTMKVGSFEPNALGLYDTLGNVWERCLDTYYYYCNGYGWENAHLGCDEKIDPAVQTESYASWNDRYFFEMNMMVRGGCWRSSADALRAARRYGFGRDSTDNHVGFRVCSEVGF